MQTGDLSEGDNFVFKMWNVSYPFSYGDFLYFDSAFKPYIFVHFCILEVFLLWIANS